MKLFKQFIITIGVGFFVMGASASDPITLTSADGSKTLEATIQEYYPSKGTAKIRSNGRLLSVPLTAFDPEDKMKFETWYQKTMAGRRMMVYFDDASSKSGGGITRKTNGSYELSIRNNGETTFENLKVAYRVFYAKDTGSGKNDQFKEGYASLGNVAARETKQINTDPVQLTSQRSFSVGGT